MSATRTTTLGLGVAMLCLLASLALAGESAHPEDLRGVSPVVTQGTVTVINGHNQATVQLDDGTRLTIQEKPWQQALQVGDRVQCTTEWAGMPHTTTTCE